MGQARIWTTTSRPRTVWPTCGNDPDGHDLRRVDLAHLLDFLREGECRSAALDDAPKPLRPGEIFTRLGAGPESRRREVQAVPQGALVADGLGSIYCLHGPWRFSAEGRRSSPLDPHYSSESVADGGRVPLLGRGLRRRSVEGGGVPRRYARLTERAMPERAPEMRHGTLRPI